MGKPEPELKDFLYLSFFLYLSHSLFISLSHYLFFCSNLCIYFNFNSTINNFSAFKWKFTIKNQLNLAKFKSRASSAFAVRCCPTVRCIFWSVCAVSALRPHQNLLFIAPCAIHILSYFLPYAEFEVWFVSTVAPAMARIKCSSSLCAGENSKRAIVGNGSGDGDANCKLKF